MRSPISHFGKAWSNATDERIELADSDPSWPTQYETEVRALLSVLPHVSRPRVTPIIATPIGRARQPMLRKRLEEMPELPIARPMFRIGLISDTHGLLRAEATAFLRGCDFIVHGGDIGDPSILEVLAALAPVRAVRGNKIGRAHV